MVTHISFEIDQSTVTKRGAGEIKWILNRGYWERWRDRYLPRHFQGGAAARYGYKPQNARYIAWKRRKVGHNIPYVLTGKLRDEIRTNCKITGTQYGSQLKARSYFPMREEMRRDLEQIIPEEQADLALWYVNEFARLAGQPQYHRQRRRRK